MKILRGTFRIRKDYRTQEARMKYSLRRLLRILLLLPLSVCSAVGEPEHSKGFYSRSVINTAPASITAIGTKLVANLGSSQNWK